MCLREARLQAPHPHQGPGLTAARCWKRLECSPSVSSGTLENSTLHGSILLCTVLDRWQTACMQCVGEQFEQICYGRHKLRPTHCQLECTKTLCVCTYCPPHQTCCVFVMLWIAHFADNQPRRRRGPTTSSTLFYFFGGYLCPKKLHICNTCHVMSSVWSIIKVLFKIKLLIVECVKKIFYLLLLVKPSFF